MTVASVPRDARYRDYRYAAIGNLDISVNSIDGHDRYRRHMGLWDDRVRARLAAWRAKRPIPQKRIGVAVGWSQSMVSGYFNGVNNADLDTLAALAKLWGRDLIELFADQDVPADPVTARVMSLYNGISQKQQELINGLMTEYVALKARPVGEERRSAGRASSGPKPRRAFAREAARREKP